MARLAELGLIPITFCQVHVASDSIAVIGVEPAVKYSFVKKGTHQTSRKGQYKAELTLPHHLHVKALITAIRAIL